MEELTTIFAIFGEMIACIALGWEMRVVAEMKHRERKKRRADLESINESCVLFIEK
jgi:hypothetical protein